jgi:hypothetical protein
VVMAMDAQIADHQLRIHNTHECHAGQITMTFVLRTAKYRTVHFVTLLLVGPTKLACDD